MKFADDKSYTVLDAIRNTMRDSNESLLWNVAELNQYFCMAPFLNTGNEIFVDCGACTGDTIERFMAINNGVFKHIYAFEPGKKQLVACKERIQRVIKEWAINEKSITLISAATGAENMELLFESGESITSSMIVHDDKGEAVRVVSLDSFFVDLPLSFIKLDVEGMEYDTLLGARQTIAQYRPKIAVCVYHKPDDLFRIYSLLRDINPDYMFKLRHHSSLLMETVLYCY